MEETNRRFYKMGLALVDQTFSLLQTNGMQAHQESGPSMMNSMNMPVYDFLGYARQRAKTLPPESNPLALELAFTETYRRHTDPIERELACLEVLFPAILEPIRPEDVFAGRIRYPLVGLSPEPAGFGYYCQTDNIKTFMKEHPFSPRQADEVACMLEFWQNRTTSARTRSAIPAADRETLATDHYFSEPGIAFPLYRMAGPMLDYGKLLRLGIPGLHHEINLLAESTSDDQARQFYRGGIKSLALFRKVIWHYAKQAHDCSTASGRQMEAAMLHIADHPPETLFQAIELAWLYTIVSGTLNYGRMDIYLGNYLEQDLTSGRLDPESALKLLQGFWRQMQDYSTHYNSRIIIGGLGRPNEKQADAFALLAIEATRTVLSNRPQLTLRFHQGQNPTLYDAALACIAQGRTFPMLYNDEVNVPSVMKAFGVDRQTAEQYVPFGCGEYVIDHMSVGTPSGLINLAKALEVTLHNGYDPIGQKPHGLKCGDCCTFRSFEDLWSAYARQVEYHLAAMARFQKLEYDIAAGETAFLWLSLLYDDCLSQGRAILSGGVRYLGGTLESYGNTNAADSLTAIDQLVYRQRKYTLSQIVQACDANFVGYETMHQELMRAPKYGNDDPVADAMAMRVHEHVCGATAAQARQVGLSTYLIVVINNSGNTTLGLRTGATPDGRMAGIMLANANNPMPGMDMHGPTAFLNSLTKLEPAIHAGVVQNMKFSRDLCQGHPHIFKALLQGYFDRGGTQAMVTVLNRHDLEAAMREPQKWGHLMVRVGGFSARFVDLSPEVQRDILKRTLH